jgi:two-component system, LuxR family, response regulator FixJ
LANPHPVYVVDDDPGVHEWAEIVCADRGLSCRGFTSGDDFLRAAGELEPGCVLLDIRMPKRTGLQIQAELRNRGLNLPVVAMTGFGDVEVAVQSMKMGAIDFLEKPIPQEVLFEALDRCFELLDAQQAGSPPARSLS